MAYLGTKPANQVIDSTLIADGTITTSDLANNAVTSAKLDAVAQYMGFKNRIINGDMRINQRNATVTNVSGNLYSLDRWGAFGNASSKFTAQISSIAPTGFINSALCTSISAYSVGAAESFSIRQLIEGLNIADFGWGTANAQPASLSFWVRSSLTGTFGGSITNHDASRSYPFSYTISSANTFEYKTITITGDTTGTWLTTNGIGLRLSFSLGAGSTASGTAGSWSGSDFRSATGAVSVVGTNGATFYITGVQLEKGTTTTSFDYRSYGAEELLCQRYYYKQKPALVNTQFGNGFATSSTAFNCLINFPVTMRTNPTSLEQSGVASNFAQENANGAALCSAVPTFYRASTNLATINCSSSGLTSGQGVMLRPDSTNAFLAWSAEL
jgi:hypothetical protein